MCLGYIYFFKEWKGIQIIMQKISKNLQNKTMPPSMLWHALGKPDYKWKSIKASKSFKKTL
jgi:hypothetical protein